MSIKTYRILCSAALSVHAFGAFAGESHYQPTLRQAIALSQLPPKLFPGLPPFIVDELETLGCNIGQSYLRSGVPNALRGEFLQSGQLDWVVLCSEDQNLSVLIFPGGGSPAQAIVGPWEDEVSVEMLAPDRWRWGFQHFIQAVGEREVHGYHRAYGGPKPPPITHAAIEVYCCEKGSTVYYWHEGAWLELSGAD
ncbi:MAG: hypothetical protein ACPHN2_16975 [Sinimarinibacterium flocculans]|uniref:hypothetical protein n=1 Tax=Sinimarinibacterium flocculans TaxID=985250 RepID=UPI003C457FEC